MDILSLNKLFAIPEFLVIRNIKREQNELIRFSSAYVQEEYGGELLQENLHEIEENKKDIIGYQQEKDNQNKENDEFEHNEQEKDLNSEEDHNSNK